MSIEELAQINEEQVQAVEVLNAINVIKMAMRTINQNGYEVENADALLEELEDDVEEDAAEKFVNAESTLATDYGVVHYENRQRNLSDKCLTDLIAQVKFERDYGSDLI